MAAHGHSGQSGRLAHGHREDTAPSITLRRERMLARKHEVLGARAGAEDSLRRRELDAASSTTTSETICCGSIFTACHPVLSRRRASRSRSRLLGGLTTEEIARAFLVPEATIAQRIVRAKRTLSDARVPFEIPRRQELAARLSSVLEVIYLVFNEGYSATAGDGLDAAGAVRGSTAAGSHPRGARPA